MAILNLSVPDRMMEFIDAQVEDGQFADAADYLRDLVRRDQEQRLESLRQLVADARSSGVSNRGTDEIFAEAVKNTRSRGTYRE